MTQTSVNSAMASASGTVPVISNEPRASLPNVRTAPSISNTPVPAQQVTWIFSRIFLSGFSHNSIFEIISFGAIKSFQKKT